MPCDKVRGDTRVKIIAPSRPGLFKEGERFRGFAVNLHARRAQLHHRIVQIE